MTDLAGRAGGVGARCRAGARSARCSPTVAPPPRGPSRPRPSRPRPAPRVATAPPQGWTWESTDRATTGRGRCCYLDLLLALCSRQSGGWEVQEHASADPAAARCRQSPRRAGVDRAPLTRHADHGGPMTGATRLATRQKRGVVPAFNRPSVSNDQPGSAALFRTLKDTPADPDAPCEAVAGARAGVATGVPGYHEQHGQRATRFVTPGLRHRGEEVALLQPRRAVDEAAKARQPCRWSGAMRN